MLKRALVKFYRIENVNGRDVEAVVGYGIISEDHPGMYKPFIKYNQFGPTKKIPEDVGIVSVDPRIIEAQFMGDRIFKSDVKPIDEYTEYSGYEREVQIMYNYSIPYVVRLYPDGLVRIFEDAVYVFQPADNVNFGDSKTYTRLVNEYVAERVFIPDGYIDKPETLQREEFLDGNTMLLYLGKKNYVYIAETVFEFKAPGIITHYYSPVFANEVPYPIGIADKHVINFAEFQYARYPRASLDEDRYMYAGDLFYPVASCTVKVKSLKGRYLNGLCTGVVYRT
jgi:hypothetical protein